MSLEFRHRSTHWLAVFVLPTGRKTITLSVPIQGQRPAKITQRGDVAFEASRVRAQVAHDELKARLVNPQRAIRAAQEAIELATQSSGASVQLAELHEIWQTLGRADGELAPATVANHLAYARHFLRFMSAHYQKITDPRLVSVRMATEWSGQLKKDGYQGKTFNNYVAGLSAMFCAATVGLGTPNPFSAIKRAALKGTTAHRKPFTLAEVVRIYEACRTDALVGPMVIVALNTGMRRADCAQLKWSDVNLAEGFIRVFAGKTGEMMDMPILTKLREVLEQRPRTSAYVFAEAAALFNAPKDNTNRVTLQLKKILKAAGIDYDRRNDEFVSPVKRLRKASISGMHAFKTTFVTIALDAGVPEPTVKKIVGNQVVDVVLKHYYRPAREEMANKMRALLPSALTGEKASDSLRDLLIKMEASSWRELRDRALQMLPDRSRG